ncbi:hypothetical protein M3193_09965 [Sporosarcina luteola]|uniref:hypothetical protein n=1 Tax=Sporosarcina luteola TaxID=582850 RepID=UPI00203B704A|nr:hypothetical protein [Sporosarcina luteola]MCM3744470.1 hypothetical protein [Sporosarcina luteola]
MEKRYVGRSEAVKNEKAVEIEDAERDSRAQLTDSGEVLSGDDSLQPRDENTGTVPRINTEHL